MINLAVHGCCRRLLGDEGKGKIISYLALKDQIDLAAREEITTLNTNTAFVLSSAYGTHHSRVTIF